jgi:glucose 1-dehydrogenase
VFAHPVPGGATASPSDTLDGVGNEWSGKTKGEPVELRLDGMSALVTGASGGIGQGIALALGAAGADVMVVYHRDEAGAEATASQIRAHGRRTLVQQTDVADPAQVETLFAAHLGAFGGIDVLVNNAGVVNTHARLHEQPMDEFERVMRTNFYGAFSCSRLAARAMIDAGRGGRIINISSVHEEACGDGAGAYCISKAALRNLTRTMAIELGPHGITVNDIAPGMILTEGMNQRAYEDEAYRAQAAEQIVARRAGVPADIANMALFLASPAASYCTGSTHYVDGGWMLTWPPV